MALDVSKIQPKVLPEVEKQPMIPAAPGKAAEEIVTGIRGGLKDLVELFELSPGITDQDKEKLMSIVKNYKDLIDNNLGAAPGEAIKRDEPPKTVGQVALEAGIASVIPSL